MAYTVLEALSTGTPVVATAIPGHAYIGEQVEACRITSIRPDSLRRAIGAVLDDDSEVKAAQGEAAHDWIVDNLSVAAISEQLMSLYRRELPTSSPGPSPRERTARRRTATPRVVQVADYANAGGGSFIPMLAAACGAVSERGWRAEVVLPELAAGSPWLEPLEESGAEVRFAPEVGRDGIRRWLRDTAEDEGGSTIHHCHFTSFDVSAALAAVGVRGSHTVWHVHSALSSDPAVIARNLVKFGAVSRFVSAIVCPAPDLGRALQRRGVPASRLAFVPNAIDIARFAPAGTEEREAARRDLDLPTSGPIALGFGWDWEIKSAELFLRAAHAATERSQDLHAVLITEDERGNDLRAELRMDGAMTFLEPVTDVRPLLAASDVFVAASAAEGGTPLAVLEALASGVPVVASDIPAHRYIAERSRGVVLSARETTEMGTAIAGVVNAAEPVGTELAAEFGLDRWSAQILDIYEAIV